MASSTQSSLFSLLIILLSYRLHNLQACPLPANASCAECDVLRYIQGLDGAGHNRQLNVNLTVALDLDHSQNTAINFIRNHTNSGLYRINSLDSVEGCLGSNHTVGTACTHNIEMVVSSSCRWNYTCDYSPNRFPQYLWKAECTGSAHPITYSVPILALETERESGCLPFAGGEAVYRWKLEEVTVACTCTNSHQK